METKEVTRVDQKEETRVDLRVQIKVDQRVETRADLKEATELVEVAAKIAEIAAEVIALQSRAAPRQAPRVEETPIRVVIRAGEIALLSTQVRAQKEIARVTSWLLMTAMPNNPREVAQRLVEEADPTNLEEEALSKVETRANLEKVETEATQKGVTRVETRKEIRVAPSRRERATRLKRGLLKAERAIEATPREEVREAARAETREEAKVEVEPTARRTSPRTRDTTKTLHREARASLRTREARAKARTRRPTPTSLLRATKKAASKGPRKT